MRPLRLLLAPLALATPLAAGCGHDAPLVPRSAIAVVGDRTITRTEFEALIAQARDSYRNRKQAFPAEDTRAYGNLKSLAVRLLVERAQLEQKAPGLGVDIQDGAVDARLLQLKNDAFGGSEARYRARLREEGMTDADVRSAVRAELLSAAVYQAVTADVSVPTQAAKQYYESHVATYSTPPTRVVRHILVRTKAAAGGVYASLRTGGSLAALARRYSRDSSTRGHGGLITLIAGRTAPSLDRVAFSLATGGVSPPFHTRFGWEIVQAVAPSHPRRTTPFAAVREAIRRTLLGQRREQAFRRWLASVRKDFAPKIAYAEGFAPGDNR